MLLRLELLRYRAAAFGGLTMSTTGVAWMLINVARIRQGVLPLLLAPLPNFDLTVARCSCVGSEPSCCRYPASLSFASMNSAAWSL